MVRWKKALSLVLAFSMMLGLIPFNLNATADADDGPYTIIWKVDGAEAYALTNVPKDTSYAYAGSQPTKEGDAAKTWVFTGWEDGSGSKYYSSFPKANGNVTYNAVFESSDREYTVTFVNYGGATMSQKTYPNNTPAGSVVRPAETPTRPDDAKNTYTFTGWSLVGSGSSGVRTVTGDAVYEPTFSSAPRQYNVTWQDDSGKTLSWSQYVYGVTPYYSGATPTKTADADYIYTFSGWSPAPSAVTGDATYTATFSRTPKTPDPEFMYTIQFVRDDGTVISTETLEAGETPTRPEAPVKESDLYYDYAFTGWNPAVGKVTTDEVYTAKYARTPRTYTLNYTSGDEVLETVTGVDPEAIPDYTGDTPTKADTQEATYSFAGWKTSIDPTTGVITRAAQYAAAAKEYPVVFTNDDGTVLQTRMEKFGATPATPKTPTKTPTVANTYTFTDWSPAVQPVNGATVYTAKYDASVRDYRMRFVNTDRDGNETQLLKDAGVHPYGTKPSDIQPVETPTRDPYLGKAYEFNGWEEKIDQANGVITYRASYNETDRYVTILWKNYNDTVLETDTMLWSGSELPTYDGETPTKEPTVDKVFTFDHWEPVVVPATDNKTYVAQYSESAREYEVKWMNGDTLLRTDTVAYGETPSYTGAEPTRESDAQKNYKFSGWDNTITPVTGPATYNAQFTSSPREYTVTINWDATVGGDVVNSGTLTTLSVPYDETPDYTPSNFADKKYTYTLKDEPMDRDYEPVTADASYTVHYVAKPIPYTVEWIDGTGTRKTTEYHFDDDISNAFTATPKKPSVKDGDKVITKYLWNGKWTNSAGETVDSFEPVSGNETYTAQFTPQYLIEWYDGDGKLLDAENRAEYEPYYVDENAMPEYNGATPTKTNPRHPEYRYTWNADAPWDSAIAPATAYKAYTANFTDERNQYNINWNYPDPKTGDEKNRPQTASADDPLNKPVDVPNYPNWVDQDGVPFTPGEKPTKDATYRPVFIITWDNPTEPDVVNKVEYKQPVEKPADSKLEGDLENQPWLDESDKPYTPHNATKNETYKPAFNITWNYPDPTDGSDKTDPEKVPYDEDVTPPINDPTIDWVDQNGDPYVPGKPTEDKTFTPRYTITWGSPTKYHEDKVLYKEPVVLPDTKNPNPLPAAVQGKEWKDVSNGKVYAPHNANRDETYTCEFTIKWNYPDKIKGDTTETVPTPAGKDVTKPLTLPDDVRDKTWVDQDDPTNEYDPDHPQPPTKDVTYVPKFTIIWDNPTEPDVVDYVPYKQSVNMPAAGEIEGNFENQPWKNEKGETHVEGHPATKDETFKPGITITWQYPDQKNNNADTTYVQPNVPADKDLKKPGSPIVPFDDKTWVNKDDPTDVYDPASPKKPTKDVTYVPKFTITWDNPTEPDVVNTVPYMQPVEKPLDAELEGTLEDQPWVNQDDNPYTPHDAFMDETYKPAYNINWYYPDPSDPTGDTGKTDPEKVPYDENVIPPTGAPDDVTWVNKDDPTDVYDPTNPQKPTGDKTYTPQYTITWGSPTKYHEDKVLYKEPVVLPDNKNPNPLPAAVQGKEWKDVSDGAVYAPHNAYRDETYSCGFVINWNYPDPTNGDTTETVPTPAGTPVTKPATLPDNVKDRTWVDKDDPANVYDPDDPQPPTKDVTYVPVFDITWDNPTEPDVVDHVPYSGNVTKPDPDKLEDTVENQPWINQDDVPYDKPYHPTKDETYKPAYDITWNYPDPTDGSDKTDPEKVPYDEDVKKPIDDPTIEWVDENGDPFVPGRPTGDKTYTPQYTINWGDPDVAKPYHVDKVRYKQPVKKPSDEVLPDAVDNKPNDDWHDKVGNTPFAEHPATKNETYVPLFNITWKPENGVDPDKNEKVKQGVTPQYDDADATVQPAKSGATFQGWNPAPYAADKDQVYTAKYRTRGGGGGGGGESTPTIAITWDVDGTKTVTNVPKGNMPKYPNGTPTKDNALFIRWTPEIVPADKPATYKAVFTDSPNYHARPDETGIDKVLETGEHVIYYRGYPDGTIKPYGNITRNETAMILYRLLLDKDVKITKSFKDVPEDAWYTEAVLTLASLGIVNGDANGYFHPEDAITRAEFTAMCVRFIKTQDKHFEFNDVSESFWAYKEIMTAAYYGWITGYPDGSFRPNAFIARCEAAAVVNRMLGRAADQEYVDKNESKLIHFPDLLKEWYYYEMVEGTNAHDYEIKNDVETWKATFNK